MRIYQSAKGFLCAESDGKNLHSRYNPDREASRFINQSIKGNPSLIIFLGAGLGYIQKALSEKFPRSEIMAVYHHDALYHNSQYSSDRISSWHPSSAESIQSFFQRHIDESRLSAISIIEWEPSALIHPRLSLQINQLLKELIQELNGNIHTTAFFGKQWLRNLLVNFLSADQYCKPHFPKAPYLIASSGPTLDKSFAHIKKYRDRFVLLALPSSLKALSDNGIVPDLQISTDPGFYSGVHLDHLYDQIPLGQPLTAGRGFWKKQPPLFLLNQSTPYEEELFRFSGIVNTRIPSNGTVSGTALELAAHHTDKIYFAGLDLCFRDIQSHVAPHSFDMLLRNEASRLSPVQSVYYDRAFPAQPDFENKIRTGRSLDTYRNWFSRYSRKKHLEIKRLNPSPVEIDNVKEGRLSELKPEASGKMSFSLYEAPAGDRRKQIVLDLLRLWIRQLENGENDKLFYFIDTENFTGSKNRSDAILFLNRLKDVYGQ